MTTKAPVTWSAAARLGAKLGAELTVVYALGFAVYASVRAVADIAPVKPDDALQTALAVIVSLLVPIASIGLLMLLIAAMLGAVTALIVYGLLPVFDPNQQPLRAAAVGGGVTAIIAAALYAGAQSLPGGHFAAVHVETFLFWLALPLLLYVGAGIVGATRLNARFHSEHRLLTVR
jgi:hypothetical protein